MIADLHAHYPMHVVMDESDGGAALARMTDLAGRRLPDRLRALILRIASALFSDKVPGRHRVTAPLLREGGVGVALSVLYSPFDELDDRWPDEPPSDAYFGRLLEQLRAVEDEVATHDPSLIRVVKTGSQLDAAVRDGATALVHCVEGGFHLGDDTAAIDANAERLAREGVAYVTVAHLFYRRVASVANAIPVLVRLPDALWDRLTGQPAHDGLTDRGRAAIEALHRNRILVDLSHMRPDAADEALDLLDRLDPARTRPVLATHGGFRFGDERYMLDAHTIERIAQRDGVVGLIMAQLQMTDGLRRGDTTSFDESFAVIRAHVDRIREITGSHRHAAIGSDLDGFIKPTLAGIDSSADLGRLDTALHDHYGADADLIASGNAIRVLRALWSA